MSIYLDNASTTKPKQEVIDAMMPYFTEEWYNPSALYGRSQKIKKDIENARKTIGDFINADGDEIYFTSGGSESNCFAIQGFVNYCNRKGKTPTIITSVIEHKSILSCVDNMNADMHYIGVDNEGHINMKALNNVLNIASKEGNTILVSIQYANNEIGTIQYIKEIAELVHKYNALFHTDAVQAFGHVHIDVKKIDVDMLSASGHKIGAPKGIGFLYKKNTVEIDPLIYGTQMDGMRGGTENVPYIIGMSKAVELLCDDMPSISRYKNYFMNRLEEEFGCKINGSIISRLPNNISATFPQNITAEALIYLLDMCEIYISSGSACNSRSMNPSYVLKEIGLTDEEATRTIRITMPDDVDETLIENVIYEIKKQIALMTY